MHDKCEHYVAVFSVLGSNLLRCPLHSFLNNNHKCEGGLCIQEKWDFVSCSQPLKPGVHFESVTVMMGTPVSSFEEHSRLADFKKSSWLLWIEIAGEIFTEAMFLQLMRN